ncbi:3-isopropylmalate dehydratase small subunit [Arthrobacter sp. KNU40]|uniref:3-isopropylmalate dehydratase small subunit n=1 Tax=Arthrobacter sp. KNU40 TaxID=3447965 RepID=UPI003F5DFDCD
MKAFKRVSGPVSVLSRDDVDTDVIIPKQFLKLVQRTGFSEYLFYDWRHDPDWNLPQNEILLAARNFGCGSSREQAVWALADYGFRVIIASSFGDIFRNNCTKNGLLPIVLNEETIAEIAASGAAEVDLESRSVIWHGGQASFEIASEIRDRLINGIDEIAHTLQQSDAIASFESRRRVPTPLTTAL